MRGSDLKEIRLKRGLKQRFIADEVLGGVTPATVCTWEKKDLELPPMAEKLIKIFLNKRPKKVK